MNCLIYATNFYIRAWLEFFINGTIDIPLLKKNLNSTKYKK